MPLSRREKIQEWKNEQKAENLLGIVAQRIGDGSWGSKPIWVCSRRDLNPCQKLERLLSLATRLREREAALRVGPT